MADISRRTVMGGLVTGAAALLGLSGAEESKRTRKARGERRTRTLTTHANEEFYTADGAFDAAAAKKAYYEMMRHYHYPIPERLRTEEFWTLDFAMGKFTEVGMAGILWMNEKEEDFFGHEIYLLPGQMIAEHKHVKTEAAGPKMEGWHVRHGHVYTYGEGTPNPGDEDRIPESHREIAKARCAVKLMPGEVNKLAGAEQWHWMLAGPEGAIVSEYATYHDGAGLRFSHPDVVF